MSLFLCLHSSAQTGNVISFGVTQFNFSQDDEFPISTLSNAGAYASYEILPKDNLSVKFQYTNAFTAEDVSYQDLRLSGLYHLRFKDADNPNKGSRLSFPVQASFMYGGLKDEVENDYGYWGLGVQLGVRFYLTNQLGIEAFYGLNRHYINSVNDTDFNESPGFHPSRQFSIGLLYFRQK